MIRVAGTDPGTSSLDLLVLQDGLVTDQCRFEPGQLQADPSLPVRWLRERGPYDLIAGPSGYGLPLIRAQACTDKDLSLLTLVRRDDSGRARQGVLGFSAVIRSLKDSGLPVVFLPGVIHLPTVPAYRKINRIDLGTADKLAVAALALDRFAARHQAELTDCNLCLVEIGTAFTACLVLSQGKVVDGVGGSSGPCGWQSGGSWDGEFAYLLSPLSKRDLFAGGVLSQAQPADAQLYYRESLVKTIAGLRAVTGFDHLLLSGRLLETEPEFAELVRADLAKLAPVEQLESLPGAWVKQAAQGSALLADGLAGGSRAALVEHLSLRRSAGTVLDWLGHPRAQEVRAAFGVD
jgi:predicted butyrate kinase (DUF1464 family)